MSYYVRLVADCENEEGDIKSLHADFCFSNEELYSKHEDSQFDSLIDDFSMWLSDNGYNEWFVTDVIESMTTLTEETAIKPIIITS